MSAIARSSSARGKVLGALFAAVLLVGFVALTAQSGAASPKTFAFSTSSYSYNEAAGTVSVTVVRAGNANWSGSVYVNIDLGASTTAFGETSPGDIYNTWGPDEQVSFASGEKSKSLQFTIVQDTADEPDEFVALFLDRASNGTEAQPNTAALWIRDDDLSGASLSIGSDQTVDEEDGAVVVPVTLSAAADAVVSVKYATSDDSALAADDYVQSSGSLVFAPGVTEQLIAIGLVDDSTAEPSEDFNLTLSDFSNAGFTDTEAVITINDTDPDPSLSISDESGWEGEGPLVFDVTMNAESGKEVKVDYADAGGGSAFLADDGASCSTTGVDLEDTTGTLTFAPGETTKTISVPICPDDAVEDNETFRMNLSGAVNASILDDFGVGTIKDDEPYETDVTFDASSPSAAVGQVAHIQVLNTSGDAIPNVGIRAELWRDTDGDAADPFIEVNLVASGTASTGPTGELISDVYTYGAAEGDHDWYIACVPGLGSATSTACGETLSDADTYDANENTSIVSLPAELTFTYGHYFWTT